MNTEEKEEDDGIVRSAPFSKLFRYATYSDKWLMFIGLIFSCAGGVVFPLVAGGLGLLADIFDPRKSPD